MSLEIINIQINEIIRNDVGDLLPLHSSESLEPKIDTAKQELVETTHRAFVNKPAKGYGFFKQDSNFKNMLDEMLSGEDFLQFAFLETTHLINELSKYPFADTGLVVFAHYRSLATEYLAVAIIPFTEGMNVTLGLKVNKFNYLNVPSITIAAVINLTEYQTNSNELRYVTFLKGRSGRRVSDFFLDFLGLEVGFDPKQQNQVLIQAVEDFIADSKDCDSNDAFSIRKQTRDHAFDVAKAGDEVTIAELSHELPEISDQTFQDYVTEQGYELAESFPVDKQQVERLVKFKGAGGGLKITFDRQLLSERVFYDPETDTLTIKGTPPNLRDQLRRSSE
nr:nucleoid-associated protein YejK [uncultured Vibrio sp.]